MVDKKTAQLSNEDEFNEDDEDTQKDKFLTFRIANEEFAVEIRFVTEIIGMLKITEVPDTSNFVKGVINLRGKIIPVIDVRLRFNLEAKAYGDRTCIIVVNVLDTTTGLIVDEVSEVLDMPSTQIDPPPRASKSAANQFVSGIGKVGDSVKIVLNVEKLLSDKQLAEIRDVAADNAVKPEV